MSWTNRHVMIIFFQTKSHVEQPSIPNLFPTTKLGGCSKQQGMIIEYQPPAIGCQNCSITWLPKCLKMISCNAQCENLQHAFQVKLNEYCNWEVLNYNLLPVISQVQHLMSIWTKATSAGITSRHFSCGYWFHNDLQPWFTCLTVMLVKITVSICGWDTYPIQGCT